MDDFSEPSPKEIVLWIFSLELRIKRNVHKNVESA